MRSEWVAFNVRRRVLANSRSRGCGCRLNVDQSLWYRSATTGFAGHQKSVELNSPGCSASAILSHRIGVVSQGWLPFVGVVDEEWRYRKLAVKRRSGGESLGRETLKPRMCVGRNRDQPWSYRYCRISFQFRFPPGEGAAITGGLGCFSPAIGPAGRSASQTLWTRHFPLMPF